MGLPSINLLNMRGLLPRYGLPIDPVPLPAAGEGGVYEQATRPDRVLLIGMLALTAIALVLYKHRYHRHGRK